MEKKLLAKELLNELESIHSTTLDIIKQADLSIVLCRNLLSKFKKMELTSDCKDQTKEIEFFKEISAVSQREQADSETGDYQKIE